MPEAASAPADLLVVGFGPVGAALAGLAAGHGLRVVVVDRERDIHPLPRAAHCDHEVLRILQEIGCADEVVGAVVRNEGMDFLDAQGDVLFGMRSPATSPSGWPASVLFHQPSFEAALRRSVSAAGAELRLGVGLQYLAERGDVVVGTLDDGTEIPARYAVGCDGARSTVRRLIGAAVDDLGFEESWLVVDIVLRRALEGLPARVLQVCDPARPATVVPMPAPRLRFEFMMLPQEQPEELLDPARIRELLAGRVEIDADAVDVERSALYTFHGLIATRWRAGRMLLAGDAAHQMPPFLGQGMCSGMRDAANLAWKLAAVLRHDAPDGLLDSYQAEREPHVRGIVASAVGFGRIICTTDAQVAADRDAGFRAGGAARQETALLPGLLPGPGVADGGGGLSAQPVVDGVRLDDLVGPRFGLITLRPLATDDPVRRWWGPRAACLDAATHPELEALLDGTEAILIRPDRYVFGTGSAAGLTALAAAWLGRSGTSGNPPGNTPGELPLVSRRSRATG